MKLNIKTFLAQAVERKSKNGTQKREEKKYLLNGVFFCLAILFYFVESSMVFVVILLEMHRMSANGR